MADWKDRLLPASFRGIPFRVLSHEHTGGRNNKRHEIPDRDGGFNEDLGKKTDVFRIEGHVIGDNYFFIRDSLVSALKAKDSGVLIHPYLGIKNVIPEGFSLREDTMQGRIAFFTMTFGEAGANRFPFAQIDAVVAFVNAAVTAVAQIKNAFDTAYVLSGVPEFVFETAKANLDELGETFEAIFPNVRKDSEAHAKLKKEVEDFKANTESLSRDSTALSAATDSIIEGFKDLVPDTPDSSTIDSSSGRDDKLAVFNTLVNFSLRSDSLSEITPSRRVEKANTVAVEDLVQQLAIVRLSEQTVDKEFKSNEEAEAQRTSVIESVEVQLKKDISDEAFQAFEDLVAKLVLAVPDTNSVLANVKALEQLNEIPSIVLSYDLYESAENEQDLIDRNKIREPGFTQGSLEVLSQ